MKILLTRGTGGIGSAIKDSLQEHEFVSFFGTDPIDWVIFAHGVIDERVIIHTFDVNTIKCIRDTEAFLPRVFKGIIYISSTAGIRGNTKFPIYSASKAAINSYAETMSRTYPDVQFYALCPGPTDTKMWRSLSLPGEAQDPAEVAKAIKLIMDGHFKSGDIITIRNGEITV